MRMAEERLPQMIINSQLGGCKRRADQEHDGKGK